MKTLLTFSLALLFACAAPAQELINLGTAANDGTGDKLRAAGIKINTNAFNFDRRLDNIEGQTNQFGTGGSGITNVGSALLSASNYYARVVSLTTNDNVSLTLSNAQNNTAYILAPGSYAITPSVLSSNLSGGTQYRGITFAGKTNVAILGLKGSTIIDGSSEYGELLVITNSSGITVDGLKFYGKTNHNWTQVIPTNHLWAGIRIANSEKITFQNCDISRHFNHGIADMAANFSAVPASTNQILIQFNTLEDCGSWRTNSPLAFDGTAIVPTGWTVRGNTIRNALRGIEPYLAADGQPSVIYNFIATDNYLENIIDEAITTAGSTNFRNAVVSMNVIRNFPGASFHGTNLLNHTASSAIVWNGGHGWRITDNEIRGVFGHGIQVGAVFDGLIARNTITDATNISSSLPILIQGAYRTHVIDNHITRGQGRGLLLYGHRDSEVAGNKLIDTYLSGSAAIRVSTFAPLVSSNLTIRNNYIRNTTAATLAYGIEDQLGNTVSIKIYNNEIQNAGTNYQNLSGTQWTIRDLDAGSTNRLIAAHEVRTQIEAGSNITLATNSSGVVTITGAAGGGSSISTNGSQFGASVPITIKDGPLFTNAVFYGTISNIQASAFYRATGSSFAGYDAQIPDSQIGLSTVNGLVVTNASGSKLNIRDAVGIHASFASTGAVVVGHLSVGTNITAQSFIGSGTGTPILKLQTMMSADNAFAITVDTNYFGLTNTFNFTNLAVGKQMRVKSVSNGNPTWEVPQLVSGVQTNTTSVQADWTGAELVHITNSLIANVVIIPTNMIGGRSLRVIAQASTQTYTLSVSNAAGTVVLYPFASTNGGSAYTVTNGQTVELDLLSLNGKIHAAMGRFQ